MKSEMEVVRSAKEDLLKKHNEALMKIKALEVLDVENKNEIGKMTVALEQVRILQKNPTFLTTVDIGEVSLCID